MKKIITLSIVGIACLSIGFFIGYDFGHEKGCLEALKIESEKSIDQIKSDLKYKEEGNISDFVRGTAGIKSINEGTLFKSKYVTYIKGHISNSAMLATAKNITLKVRFYSKTKTLLSTKEVTIHEYIPPGKKIAFKEKIAVPSKYEDFEFSIIDVQAK